MRLTTDRTIRLVAVLAYAILTFVLSGIPSDAIRLPDWEIRLDWVFHVLEYGMLAGLLMWYMGAGGLNCSPRRAGWTALLICGFIGGANELLQAYIPGRFPSISDVIANLVGIVLVIWLVQRLKGRKKAITNRED